MRRFILFTLYCCIASFSSTTVARAGGDWVVLGGGNAFWTGNLGMSVCQEMLELRKQHSFKCVAFTPDGDWVVLLEGNDFYTSNINLPVCKKLAELQKQDADFKCVAFAPAGGWTLFWNQNGNWTEGNVPEEAFKKIVEVGKAGGALRSIAYAPEGGWVLLCDQAGAFYGGLRTDLSKTLNIATKEKNIIRCVIFTPSGDWICLTDHGWSSSNEDMAIAKQVAKLAGEKRQLQWVAYRPGDPSAGPCRLEARPSCRVKAVLTTDIAHSNATVNEWIVYAPQVPNLPSQRDVKTSFIPVGNVIEESSPLKRPVILTRITDGRKELHAVLTIEATLMSRRLRTLGPGEKAPAVPDLSAEEVANFTRPSNWLDINAKPFRDWMLAAHLTRNADETDLAFARRTFAYIKHHFTYQWPTPAHSASEVCAAGKSDCGGLSDVFTTTMRANGIPARLLAGRWALSQDKSGAQTHVKAEFFARGIGWIPVDSSGAVTDVGGGDFACFGNDDGDFIAFGEDQDFVLDSFGSGKQNVPIFQGISYWWRGGGDDKNNSYRDQWTVQKEPAR